MEGAHRALLSWARSKLKNPGWLGGLGLAAGLFGVTVPVLLGLVRSGMGIAGGVTLFVLLTLHVRFIMETPVRRAGSWWIVAVQAWLELIPEDPQALLGAFTLGNMLKRVATYGSRR
ncbi:hypothetical protein ACIBO5_17190 [Nonomuraea angiospora]|uniref:hypothetical protein n=1 Tax=Nonomuraea angiospora TaxID=46172 RepID=UPI0037ACA7F8